MGLKTFVGDFVDVPVYGSGLRLRENYSCVVDSEGIIVSIEPFDASMVNEHVSILDKSHFYTPGFIDTHCHAPQFPNRGLGTDIQLLEWLEKYTFPEEKKYADLSYACSRYEQVVKESLRCGTTCCVYFATIHKEASKALMGICSKMKQRAYVGKVCMHINCPEDYKDKTIEQCIQDNEDLLMHVASLGFDIHTIITPRFAPVCSVEMMRKLADFANDNNLLIQSHISESVGEIAWIKSLYPRQSYAQVYDECGLLNERTIMAHAVHLSDEEIQLFAKRKASVSHCPVSNYALNSGIANIQHLVENNVIVGLGTDVSGGWATSMLKVMRMAVIASRSLQFTGKSDTSLSYSDAFYLGTRGSALAIRRPDLGLFEVGCRFDALSIKPPAHTHSQDFLEERFQKYFFCGDDRNIQRIYVNGQCLDLDN